MLIPLLLGAAALYFAMHGTGGGSSTTPNPGNLPWVPPSLPGVLPVKTKERSTTLTPFPVDVYEWAAPMGLAPAGTKFVLAVASDDPTSFVGYVRHPAGSAPQTSVLGKGAGPNTQAILNQI